MAGIESKEFHNSPPAPAGNEDNGHFIRVNVHESRDFQLAVPAVALRIFSATTALEVCKMVNHKLKLPYSRVADTAVIMVHKIHHGVDGPIRHLLHTLKDMERPVDLHKDAVQKYLESTSTHQMPQDDVVMWYFRDARSTPLDLDHDISGSEISEDEEPSRNIPWDLAHLNEENCTRCAGFLLKQSSKDPNLWRKRFCILAGDKLWFTKRRPQRLRGQLLLASFLSLVAARVEESRHVESPFGFQLHTVERIYQFRAFGKMAKKEQLQKVQKGWILALSGQIIHSDENDMIGMAEHIICDTVGARERRMNSRITKTLKIDDHAHVSDKDAHCVNASVEDDDRLCFKFNSRKTRTRFILAVHDFKEYLATFPPIQEQWLAARTIFADFLKGYTSDGATAVSASEENSQKELNAEDSVIKHQSSAEIIQELETEINSRIANNGGQSAVGVFDRLWEDAVRTVGAEVRNRAPSC